MCDAKKQANLRLCSYNGSVLYMYEGTETIGNHASRKQIITVGLHSFILALFVYTVLHVSTESAYGKI